MLNLKMNASFAVNCGEAGFKLTKGLEKSDKCCHREDILNKYQK